MLGRLRFREIERLAPGHTADQGRGTGPEDSVSLEMTVSTPGPGQPGLQAGLQLQRLPGRRTYWLALLIVSSQPGLDEGCH